MTSPSDHVRCCETASPHKYHTYTWVGTYIYLYENQIAICLSADLYVELNFLNKYFEWKYVFFMLISISLSSNETSVLSILFLLLMNMDGWMNRLMMIYIANNLHICWMIWIWIWSNSCLRIIFLFTCLLCFFVIRVYTSFQAISLPITVCTKYHFFYSCFYQMREGL